MTEFTERLHDLWDKILHILLLQLLELGTILSFKVDCCPKFCSDIKTDNTTQHTRIALLTKWGFLRKPRCSPCWWKIPNTSAPTYLCTVIFIQVLSPTSITLSPVSFPHSLNNNNYHYYIFTYNTVLIIYNILSHNSYIIFQWILSIFNPTLLQKVMVTTTFGSSHYHFLRVILLQHFPFWSLYPTTSH